LFVVNTRRPKKGNVCEGTNGQTGGQVEKKKKEQLLPRGRTTAAMLRCWRPGPGRTARGSGRRRWVWRRPWLARPVFRETRTEKAAEKKKIGKKKHVRLLSCMRAYLQIQPAYHCSHVCVFVCVCVWIARGRGGLGCKRTARRLSQ